MIKSFFFFSLLTASCILFIPPLTYAATTDTNNTNINVVVNPTSPPSAPTVIFPPTVGQTTTTNPSITVSGVAESASTVRVYVNAVFRGQVVAAVDGSFSLNVPLDMGINNIVVTATNFTGTSPDSLTAVVIRNNPPSSPLPTPTSPSSTTNLESTQATAQPPNSPIITSIQDNSTVNDSHIVVSGWAEPGSIVGIILNGKVVAEVTADSSGFFSVTIELTEGENIITATARNQFGKSQVTRLKVFYKKIGQQSIEQKPSIHNKIFYLEIFGGLLGLFIFIFLFVVKRRKKDQQDGTVKKV